MGGLSDEDGGPTIMLDPRVKVLEMYEECSAVGGLSEEDGVPTIVLDPRVKVWRCRRSAQQWVVLVKKTEYPQSCWILE